MKTPYTAHKSGSHKQKIKNVCLAIAYPLR
jgi:hypothetical protein